MVDGAQHALDFLKMESGEWKKAVELILAPLIAADQNQLFQQLELNQYNAVYPKKTCNFPIYCCRNVSQIYLLIVRSQKKINFLFLFEA